MTYLTTVTTCTTGFLRRLGRQRVSKHYATAAAVMKQLVLSELEASAQMKVPIVTNRTGLNLKIAGQTNTILNFATNDYLGLSSHPQVVEAGKQAMDRFGAGLGGVLVQCGYTDIHKELEEKLARFHGKEDCLVYTSGYAANVGLFHVLLSEDDAVLSDELNHASIVDGIRLCQAKRFVYKHLDMIDLKTKLQSTQSLRQRLIVTDGVFSMDAVTAPLSEICQLAEKYNTLVMKDESHAAGVFGETGRGSEEYCGVQNKVDVITSSLSKAVSGIAGGYICSTKELVALLRQRSRSAVFSTALPPASVACISKAVDLITENPEMVRNVRKKADRFRREMSIAGFQVLGDPGHPICPVMVGDADLTNLYVRELQERGILVIGIWYPIVPKGKARIRIVITAAHSDADIDRAVETFAATRRHLMSRGTV